MGAVLTAARLAVWQAIDNFPPLNPGGVSVFRHTYRYDSTPPNFQIEVGPALSEMPVLGVFPAHAIPEWWTSQIQAIPFALNLVVWTPEADLELAELLPEQLIYALHQSGPAPGFVKRATGYYPTAVGPIQFQKTKLGAIRTLQTIVLRLQIDPLTGSA